MRRLADHEHPFPDAHLTYEGAGHIGTPGHRGPATGRFAVGGTPELDAQANADAWPRVLDFLDRHVQAKPLF
jgi:dienelactone hydrolase